MILEQLLPLLQLSASSSLAAKIKTAGVHDIDQGDRLDNLYMPLITSNNYSPDSGAPHHLNSCSYDTVAIDLSHALNNDRHINTLKTRTYKQPCLLRQVLRTAIQPGLHPSAAIPQRLKHLLLTLPFRFLTLLVEFLGDSPRTYRQDPPPKGPPNQKCTRHLYRNCHLFNLHLSHL